MKSLNSIKNAYFLGIGGVSMSSLAMILKSRGGMASGYDMNKSDITKMLEANGICVDYEYNPSALDGVDTLVFSAAISRDDPNMVAAQKMGIDILTRAQFLGLVCGDFPHAIGVSGTHGKSTTTGMLGKICLEQDAETAILSGASLPYIGGLYKTGNGDRIVFEACEYKNSYHSMKPTVKVVLNVEHDHVDFFPTENDVIASFNTYIDMTRTDGGENIAIVNFDCPNAVKSAHNTSAQVKYFSVKQKTHFYAKNIFLDGGYGKFDIVLNDSRVIDGVKLGVPGEHNVSNAVAAAAAAYSVGVSPECIKKGLESFNGVSRRFEKLGQYNGAVLVDDYAHHPDEIRATLSTARFMPYKRIICVFQPHTYTRTFALLDDFAKALSAADKVYIADIFPAREKNTMGVSSADIVSKMKNAEFVPGFEEIADVLKGEIGEGDLVITMGAGEAYKTARMLMGENV